MGCFLITVFCIIGYLITAAIVGIASMIFGFTFSWWLAFGVFVIFMLLKMLF